MGGWNLTAVKLCPCCSRELCQSQIIGKIKKKKKKKKETLWTLKIKEDSSSLILWERFLFGDDKFTCRCLLILENVLSRLAGKVRCQNRLKRSGKVIVVLSILKNYKILCKLLSNSELSRQRIKVVLIVLNLFLIFCSVLYLLLYFLGVQRKW